MKIKFEKYKPVLFFIILLSISCSQIFAQPNAEPNGESKKERVEALRVAYITNRLNLTSEEAQKFWPIFNQYKSDLRTLRHNFHPKDAEAPLTADQQLEFDQKKLDLKKKYKPQFESAIGKDKVNLLVTAEEDFKKELMRIMKDRRDGREPRPVNR
jgi:hypothetical protein